MGNAWRKGGGKSDAAEGRRQYGIPKTRFGGVVGATGVQAWRGRSSAPSSVSLTRPTKRVWSHSVRLLLSWLVLCVDPRSQNSPRGVQRSCRSVSSSSSIPFIVTPFRAWLKKKRFLSFKNRACGGSARTVRPLGRWLLKTVPIAFSTYRSCCAVERASTVILDRSFASVFLCAVLLKTTVPNSELVNFVRSWHSLFESVNISRRTMSSISNCLFTAAVLIAFAIEIIATQTMDARIRDDSDLSQVRIFDIFFPLFASHVLRVSSITFSLARGECVQTTHVLRFSSRNTSKHFGA